MDQRSGENFYRIATGVAVVMVLAALGSYFLNSDRGLPVISVVALALAAVVWLCGWAGRHLLAGR